MIFEGVMDSDPYVAPAMLQQAVAIARTGKHIDASFFKMDIAQALDVLERSCESSRKLVEAVKQNKPYQVARADSRLKLPFPCQWDSWKAQHAIATHAAETAGLMPWEVAVYAGWERNPSDIARAFREGYIAFKPEEQCLPPVWRVHVYLRGPAPDFIELCLRNLLKFASDALERYELIPPRRRDENNHASS